MSSNLFGQHSDYGEDFRGNFNEQEYVDFSTLTLGGYNKYQELSSGRNTKHRFSWFNNRSCKNDPSANRRKINQDYWPMSGSSFTTSISTSFD